MSHPTTAEQGRAVIDEYLNVVNWCLSDRGTPGHGPLGYAPTLLLFSIVDAISHSGQPENHSTWLDALNDGTGFNLSLKKRQSLVKCFRHKLAHAAITAPGRFITDEPHGEPFDFVGDDVTRIRVIPFWKVVSDLWTRKRATFDTTNQLGAVPTAHRATSSPHPGGASGVP